MGPLPTDPSGRDARADPPTSAERAVGMRAHPAPRPLPVWRLSADVGGTFTDAIARDPHGRAHTAKLLSSGVHRISVVPTPDPRVVLVTPEARAPLWVGAMARSDSDTARIVGAGDESLTLDRPIGASWGTERRGVLDIITGEPAPVLAARLVTGTAYGAPLPPMTLRLATTRATNALLERRVAPTAMFITEGFGDLLEIGDQRRPDLFELHIRKPAPLTRLVYEVPGRIDARGAELRALDTSEVDRLAEAARRAGATTAAVALMHAWINPAHERAVAERLRAAGFEVVVASSDVSGRMGLLRRAQSAVVEAALAPIIAAYLAEIDAALGPGRRFALTSAGGLARFASFRAVDALLSGPAGGVRGAGEAGRRCGFARVLGFDMGGTSTDASRIDGAPALRDAHTVAHATIARPAVEIETVAAGGGSVCAWRDGRLTVGPRSAGAEPGPACYGRGGPLTITDADVLLGRVDAARASIPLDAGASARAADALLAEARGAGLETREALAEGLVAIADAAMAEAIRAISARRGYDPADHALVAFGGAGPQHACGVAERLGVRSIVVPPRASLLSAVGVDAAPVQRTGERPVMRPLAELVGRRVSDQRGGDGERDAGGAREHGEALAGAEREPRGDHDALTRMLDELEREAREAFAEDDGAEPTVTRVARLRLAGQEATLAIDASEPAQLGGLFLARAAEVWGAVPDRAIEVESLMVVVAGEAERARDEHDRDGIGADERVRGPADASRAALARMTRVYHAGRWLDVPRIERDRLSPGDAVPGPALVVERTTSSWVAPGWRGWVHEDGSLVLRAESAAPTLAHAEAVRRELLVRRLSGIAEGMGEALGRTAISANIRERLDYSCGVLDPDGRLVASAPHIPVHLGALGACVRAMLGALGPLAPGEAAITNHPAFGGSHLPDVTVVQPVYDGRGALLGYVASRAHHAEIGGRTPGSMPQDAGSLAEEGVVFAPMRINVARDGALDAVRDALLAGAYPSRAVDDNLADLRAALAAGHYAARELRALADAAGAGAVRGAMGWIIDHTAGLVRGGLALLAGSLADEPWTEALDDGTELRVRARIDAEGGLVLDFAGTSGQHPANLNAPLAVTRSVVAYVLRLLVRRDVPLNDGLLGSTRILAPEGCILNPRFEPDPARCPAVAAGNTETSQRLADLLIRVLGLLAGSQGTMNNLLLGNDTFGYYETIAGGAGAGPGFAGADGVQAHMTNTAATDPEVLERRFPMRLERFALRRGSGGTGRWRGGEGVERELVALAPLHATLITQRRARGAPGMLGGGDGLPGEQGVRRSDGSWHPLRASDAAGLEPGDRLMMRTPGGGGWGPMG